MLKTLSRQAAQNGMLVKLGLLKSGNNDNMDSYTGAESEMSFGFRSYLHRVNDQVRKRQNAICNKKNAYNPFSDESKAMFREMGNVELFELCETIPKVQ